MVHFHLIGKAYGQIFQIGNGKLHGIHGVSSSLESFFPISYHVLGIFARGKVKKATKRGAEVCRVS
jgi:hypothetical protein